MTEELDELREPLGDTFEPFLDEYLKALTVKIMIMGPKMVSKEPSANLRRELVERCSVEGLSVVAERGELLQIGKKKLKAGLELTVYELAVARWSDLVVLIADSAGSLAELGYFATLKKICPRMLIFLNGEYESTKDESYLWQGPGKAAKNYHADVSYVNYSDIDGIWDRVKERIENERVDKLRKSLESKE